MRLIDTHCHLNFEAFSADFLSVAEKSKERGVEKVIIIGSDVKTSKRALEVALEINESLGQKWAYVAVGIHPVHFKGANSFEKIEELAKGELVVAIGETGLDLHHLDRDVLPQQKKLLYKHIELAKKLDIPVILHNRKADDDFEALLDEIDIKKAVFHCFSAGHSFAQKVVDKGYFLSFTGTITYGNKKLKKVVKRTPLENIMIETDAPYLVPEPLKSEGISRCEPYMAIETAKKIAKEKDLDLSEVLGVTSQNAQSFFNLD